MRVLVTGISGFIGRAVTSNLTARRFVVYGLDRSPKPVTGATVITKGDILDADLVQKSVSEVDGVIHLAGVLGTSELLDSVKDAVRINVEAAVNVYNACLVASVPVVQIATGNANWTSVYPATKECAVRLAQCYAQDAGLKLSVVRAFHAYGPYQKHAPTRKFIPNAIRSAILNEPVIIFGKGHQIIDPIWVDDVAEILVRALLKANNPSGVGDLRPTPLTHIYEAGTGDGISVNNVADVIWRIVNGTNVAPKIHLSMRAGEPAESTVVGDPVTLWPFYEEFPFEHPLVKFEDGIQDTINWYRGHPEILGLELAAVRQ